MEVDLNKIYASYTKSYASSSITKILEEQYPDMSESEATKLADYITLVENEIKAYFYERYTYNDGIASQKLQSEVYNWIQKKYLWMNEANILHTINREMYYAWHG